LSLQQTLMGREAHALLVAGKQPPPFSELSRRQKLKFFTY
jgi:hypothetical protein